MMTINNKVLHKGAFHCHVITLISNMTQIHTFLRADIHIFLHSLTVKLEEAA
jgi:hypothetical protein